MVEHVEERLEAPREAGFRGRFAGRELRPGTERKVSLSFLRPAGTARGGGGLTRGGAGAPAPPEYRSEPPRGNGMGSRRQPGMAEAATGGPMGAATAGTGGRLAMSLGSDPLTGSASR